VLLVGDNTSRVGAILSRSRQFGYITGKDSSTVVMHFFHQVAGIKAGDEIATSPLSKLYPPGLAIGKIKSVAKNQGATVDVELSAPIDVLEWVVIQPFVSKVRELGN
jgi:rod shape-determining protein MreC